MKHVGITYHKLSENPGAIDLIRERLKYEKQLTYEEYEKLYDGEKYDWVFLSRNPAAIDLLRENLDKRDWEMLSYNTNPEAIDLLRANPDKIDKVDWTWLSSNPGAIDLLRENPDKIEKIDWKTLSANPAAIDFLKENQDKIEWAKLLEYNPVIFVLHHRRKKDRDVLQTA